MHETLNCRFKAEFGVVDVINSSTSFWMQVAMLTTKRFAFQLARLKELFYVVNCVFAIGAENSCAVPSF